MCRATAYVSIVLLLNACHGASPDTQTGAKKIRPLAASNVRTKINLSPGQITLCQASFNLPNGNTTRVFEGNGASGAEAMRNLFQQCAVERFGDGDTVCVPTNLSEKPRCREVEKTEPVSAPDNLKLEVCAPQPAPKYATVGTTWPPDKAAHAEHEDRDYPWNGHDFYSVVPAPGAPPFPKTTRKFVTWCRVSISDRFDWCGFAADDLSKCPYAVGKRAEIFPSDGGYRIRIGFTNYSEDENRELQVSAAAE